MTNNKEKNNPCPIEITLNTIGKKWTVLIIRDLLKGTKRFGELQSSLSRISPRTLSLRLKDLEKQKIIKKKIFKEIPLHVEYTLTSRGKNLHCIIDQMIKWGSC